MVETSTPQHFKNCLPLFLCFKMYCCFYQVLVETAMLFACLFVCWASSPYRISLFCPKSYRYYFPCLVQRSEVLSVVIQIWIHLFCYSPDSDPCSVNTVLCTGSIPTVEAVKSDFHRLIISGTGTSVPVYFTIFCSVP